MTNKKSTFLKRFILFCWVLFFTGVIAVGALFLLIAKGKIGYMPPIEELENPKSKYASVIFSEDNVELGRFTQEKENRVLVSYNQLSPNLVKALIATEDVRYSPHSGIDAKAIFKIGREHV